MMAQNWRLIFLTLSLCISTLYSQLPKKEKYYAIKEDIPRIKCETCQKAVKYLYGKTHDMRTAEGGTSKSRKLEEDKVIDLVEKSCNPEKEEGSWISKIDLVEKNGELRLSEQFDVGKCKRECQTVSKACEESIGDIDTDLAELLWKDRLTLSKLTNEVCYSMSSACKGKKLKLKAGERKIDEEFHVMTEDEKKADEVLKQMRGMPGMPGMEMYSREDIEKMQDQLGDHRKENVEGEEVLDSEGNLFHGEEVSFLQTVLNGLSLLWSWLKSLCGFRNNSSGEL
ncbi:hypothetical protein AWC38_SpisGene8974 [Stylophora pistillata]|uniref:Saposin B-type domain-containing protein n=1 Tax=Stylophora pistillata TaxID=50429 RepID=A0A2B4SCV1_STYPI|nr:hypothetical protein AWC38_SpisGene8974 [Stylophora pistillata]